MTSDSTVKSIERRSNWRAESRADSLSADRPARSNHSAAKRTGLGAVQPLVNVRGQCRCAVEGRGVVAGDLLGDLGAALARGLLQPARKTGVEPRSLGACQ